MSNTKLQEKPEYAWLEIYFNEFIKKGTTYYSYSALSLIAEVGGYVGLFLGCAIIQISQVFEYFIEISLRDC